MTSSCCKVGEVANRYQVLPPNRFDTIDDHLVARWCGKSGMSKTGLRPLTDWFNKRILKTVYTRQNRHQINSHITSDYELLAYSDEKEGGDLPDLLQDLREDGIDGEAIADDFISPSTLHRHLTDCLGAEKERETSNRDWESDQVATLRDRAKNDLRNVLTSLDNKGRIQGAADADIGVTLYLQCPDCSREIPFKQAIARGHVCQDHLPHESSEEDQEQSPQDESSVVDSDQTTLEQLLTSTASTE